MGKKQNLKRVKVRQSDYLVGNCNHPAKQGEQERRGSNEAKKYLGNKIGVIRCGKYFKLPIF